MIITVKNDMEEKKEIQDSKVKRLSKNYLNSGSPVITGGHGRDGSGVSVSSHVKDLSYISANSFRSQPLIESSSTRSITADVPTNDVLVKMNYKIEQIESNQTKLFNLMSDIYKKLVYM